MGTEVDKEQTDGSFWSIMASVAPVVVIITLALSLLALKVFGALQAERLEARNGVIDVFEHFQRQTFVYASMVSDNPTVRRGAHFNNTGMILPYVQSVLEQTSVDGITIHNNDQLILAMAHRPDVLNVEDENNAALKAALEGTSASSIDFTSNPAAVQSTTPIYHESNNSLIVGAVTVGYQLDDELANELRKISGFNVLFVLDNSILGSSARTLDSRELRTDESTVSLDEASYDLSFVPVQNSPGKSLFLAVASDNFATKVTLALLLLSIPLFNLFVYREQRQALQREQHRGQAEALRIERLAAVELEKEVEQRKEAQQDAEIALETAEKANQIKDEFLANVSHELRTPLNPILNIPVRLLEDYRGRTFWRCAECDAEFIDEDQDSEDGGETQACPICENPLVTRSGRTFTGDADQHAHFLELIEQAGAQLFELVEDLLLTSKIHSGRMMVEKSLVHVAGLLNAVLDKRRAEGGLKKIDLSAKIAADFPLIHVDPLKLEKILRVLVGNGMKFTPGGGKVSVDVRLAEIEPGGADWLHVDVRDSGIGIKKADLGHIFDKFIQLDGSHTRGHQGLGLGLSISKRLVEMQGGRMWVESNVGEGSVFSFVMPVEVFNDGDSDA